MKRFLVLQWLLETLQLKKLKVGSFYQIVRSAVKSFPCAKRDEMELYIKATLRGRPERIIVHCGTNDLKNKTAQLIADIISSLVKSSQQENNAVLASSIVPKKDHLYKKDKEVEIILKKNVANEKNLAFICHVNIGIRYHCNYDGNDKSATLFF